MRTPSKWGRWTQTQDKTHLIFSPDKGEPDPTYDIKITHLVTTTLEHHTGILQGKTWIRDDDLMELQRARSFLLAEYQRSELIDDPEDPALRPGNSDGETSAIPGWKRELNELLSTGSQKDESRFQEFFEKHPYTLPMPWEGHNGLIDSVGLVISQPEIPGIGQTKIPDFMVFTYNSAELYVGLIEIEAPGKRWFKANGDPLAKLTQAISQISDWKTLLSDPVNRINFCKLYHLDDVLWRRTLNFRYYLIYGRRDEFLKSPTLSKKRSSMQQADEKYMTYDRIRDGRYKRGGGATVKLDRSTSELRLKIVSLPPTFRLDKQSAPVLCGCLGLREAIDNCVGISSARKAYLHDRLPDAEKRANPWPWRAPG